MINRNKVIEESVYVTSEGNRFPTESAAKDYQVVQDLAVFLSDNLESAYASSTIYDMAQCVIENPSAIIKFLESLND